MEQRRKKVLRAMSINVKFWLRSCERTKGMIVLFEVVEECFPYSHSTPLRSLNLGRGHSDLICK